MNINLYLFFDFVLIYITITRIGSHTYLCSGYLFGMEYAATSPIDEFSLYAPGPGTSSFLSTSLVLLPKPYFGASYLFFKEAS